MKIKALLLLLIVGISVSNLEGMKRNRIRNRKKSRKKEKEKRVSINIEKMGLEDLVGTMFEFRDENKINIKKEQFFLTHRMDGESVIRPFVKCLEKLLSEPRDVWNSRFTKIKTNNKMKRTIKLQELRKALFGFFMKDEEFLELLFGISMLGNQTRYNPFGRFPFSEGSDRVYEYPNAHLLFHLLRQDVYTEKQRLAMRKASEDFLSTYFKGREEFPYGNENYYNEEYYQEETKEEDLAGESGNSYYSEVN